MVEYILVSTNKANEFQVIIKPEIINLEELFEHFRKEVVKKESRIWYIVIYVAMKYQEDEERRLIPYKNYRLGRHKLLVKDNKKTRIYKIKNFIRGCYSKYKELDKISRYGIYTKNHMHITIYPSDKESYVIKLSNYIQYSYMKDNIYYSLKDDLWKCNTTMSKDEAQIDKFMKEKVIDPNKDESEKMVEKVNKTLNTKINENPREYRCT